MEPGLYSSPRDEAKYVRRPSGRGASRLAREGVLEQGKQAQRSRSGLVARFIRQVVRDAGQTHASAHNAWWSNPALSSR